MISLYPSAVTDALHAPLAIVVPIYNEAATIESVVSSWMQVLDITGTIFQFILINDGSTDSTISVLQKLESQHPQKIIVVDKPNSGHGRSCRVGYSAAAAATCVDWVLQIDSDGQCDPSYFPEFWGAREEADCIFGKRVKRDDGLARALTSRFCRMGATILSGCDMTDPNVPYRLIRREILAKAIKRIPSSFNIHNVALTFILKKTPGLRWTYVPIRFRQRQGGKNSINLMNVAHWGTDMLLELRRLK